MMLLVKMTLNSMSSWFPFRMLITGAVAVLLAAVVNGQNLAKPMPNMDPERFTGWWYAWTRTGGLWDSPYCARALIEPKGGDDYRISFAWINSQDKADRQIMEVIDDRSIKARYLFANDDHKVAFTVLDTDYDNYFVGRALLGSRDVYYYAGRRVERENTYDNRAEEVFKDNEIDMPFHVVNQTNCPEDIKFYLP